MPAVVKRVFLAVNGAAHRRVLEQELRHQLRLGIVEGEEDCCFARGGVRGFEQGAGAGLGE